MCGLFWGFHLLRGLNMACQFWCREVAIRGLRRCDKDQTIVPFFVQEQIKRQVYEQKGLNGL
jgi:hypothetical protein